MILSGLTCALGASLLLVGCSGDDTATPAPDSGAHDGGLDATTGSDGGVDSGVDASHDGGVDASLDASLPDASHDAPSEASAADCLTGTGSDTFFTINDATKCVVGKYTVPTASLSSLTWGRHHGPLAFNGTNITRYAVPSTATGALTPTNTAVTVTGLPTTTFFWGSQALDLPFFPTLSWTAIAYGAGGGAAPGELIIVDGTGAVQKRYNVNGFFSETALAASGGRLLYTGLSPLGTAATATNANGVYAADSCGTAASNPRLLPAGDTTCADSFKVDSWGNYSGPITSDAAGNTFAILTSTNGTQEIRGFEHDTVARGAAAIAATPLATLNGFGSEFVADGKRVYFQPFDGTTYAALDVINVPYTTNAVAKTITGSASTTFLTMVTAGTSVALIVDEQNRLWVGVTNPPVGDAGATSSTFFVLRDKTP